MKQAVVLIHGIGRQRPMKTIRGFVDAVLPKPKKPNYPKFMNRPLGGEESYELRVLRALQTSSRPTTDFYEFYWAHHLKESKTKQVFWWLLSLLWRRPGSVPAQLRPVYCLLWAVGGILMVAGGYAFIVWGPASLRFLTPANIYKWFGATAAGAVLVASAVATWAVRFLAYAERYLVPRPENIATRNTIRAEGIALLRRLHESGNYWRIVLVGHSLGSVIGYDLLRFAWNDLRRPLDAERVKMPELKSFEQDMRRIFAAQGTEGGRIEAIQDKQQRVWSELRQPGYNAPWLVTDFITLGSPLTYGSFLMADSVEEFEARRREREFPLCPPRRDHEDVYYTQRARTGPGQAPVSQNILNSGALFACTRWTNIYFPYRWGVLGDIIGGPVCPAFGEGVRDVPVHLSLRPGSGGAWGWLKRIWARGPAAHTRYWKKFASKGAGRERPDTRDALQALMSALRM
jgi:hypothetical protein